MFAPIAAGGGTSTWVGTSFTTATAASVGTIAATQQAFNTLKTVTTNNNVLRIAIPVTNTGGTLTLTSLKVTTANTNDADIASAGVKLWTGTSTARSTQIGTASFSGGVASFTGLTTTLTGAATNYFWITYDIASAATINNTLDAKISAGDILITATNGATAPSTQPAAALDPAGNAIVDNYCQIFAGSSSSTYYIKSFATTGATTNINNTSTYNTYGYSRFLNLAPSAVQGSTVNFSATFNDGVNYDYGFAVFIDWNQDGDFDDAGESVYNSGAYVFSSTGSFVVPSTATAGTTRMRIVANYTATSPVACPSTGISGEYEDYSFTVTIPCTQPTVTVSASKNPICAGESVNLTAAGATSYTWVGTGLSATTGTVVSATPASTSTYSVTGTTAGCSAAPVAITITVNPIPTTVTVNPTTSTICSDIIQSITASGGVLTNSTLLSEGFNGATIPTGWTKLNSSTSGTTANADWTLRADGYAYTESFSGTVYTFHSNDNTQFYLSNSDAQGSAGTTLTYLNAPVINTTGFTSLSLAFYQHMLAITGQSGSVEVSTNNSTWTALSTITTAGTSSSFALATVDLSGYLNQPTLYIRFKYVGAYSYWWAIDNVSVTGNQQAITWTPTTNLYTNSTATTAYVAGTPATTVYVKQTNTTSAPVVTTYTASAGSGSCTTTAQSQVTVNPATVITSQPSSDDQNLCVGSGSYTLTVGATGTNLTYQWYRTTSNSTTTGNPVPSNGTSASYSVPVDVASSYYYYVKVSGTCGSTITSTISGRISVGSTIITAQPQDKSFCQNTTVTNANRLSVSATSAVAITGYQWYQTNSTTNNIPGNPGVTLIVDAEATTYRPSTVTAGTFYYFVVISSGCGDLSSSVATVTINPTPVASFGSNTFSACYGTSVQIPVSGTINTTVTYTIDGGSNQTVLLDASGNGGINTSSTLGNSATVTTHTYNLVSATSAFGCSSAISGTASVTINPLPTLTAANGSGSLNQTPCKNSAITTITYNAGGAATGVSVSGILPTGVTAIVSGTNVTISGTPTVSGNYSFTITTTGGSCTAVTANGTINIPTAITWTGASSTNWNLAANWCGGVPATTDDVVIPSSLTTYPVLPTDITVASLTINNGATVDNNGHTLTATTVTGAGTITGSASSNLVVNNTSTLHFTSGANTLKNLTIGGGTVTLGDALNITSGAGAGIVTVANGAILAAGNNLTLKSDKNGTASVAANTSGTSYITGNVTVERYTDAAALANPNTPRRAWRLLSAPFTGTTIHNAWQEGGATGTSFGTLITGEGLDASTAAAQGYDYLSGSTHTSIKHYISGAWVPLSSDNSTTGTNISIRNEQAYLVFVRGDRTVGTSGATTANLRGTGTLLQGSQTVSIGTGTFTLVGNPYASSIDFGSLYTNSTNGGNASVIKDQFYLWNSRIGTYGAYVLVTHDGTGANSGGYKATPAAISGVGEQNDNNYRYIPSGSGFFVFRATTPTSGTLTIREQDKAPGNTPPVSPFKVVPNATNVREIVVNLNQKGSDSTSVLADGFRAKFSADYEGNEEDNSAVKAPNTNENLGLIRNDINHIIEARGEVKKTDTLQLKLWNVSYRSYELQMKGDNFTSAPGIKAWLEDSYLQTRQPVDLSGGITTVGFVVNQDSGSWKSTRFRIIFENKAIVLPVTITKVSASPKNGGAEVAWTVTNEVNVKGYTVEKSADGRSFTTFGTQQAARNNPQAALTNYTAYDAQPKTGDNYYRIRIEGNDGKVSYSEIVKVTIGASGTGIQITLYPNPVREGKANLVLTNLKEGTYLVSVFSGSGQTVYQKKVTITLAGTTQSEQLLLGNSIAQGSYQIRVADSKGDILFTDKLIVGR